MNHILSFLLLISISFLFIMILGPITVSADDIPLEKMRDEVISYFIPMTGKIINIENDKVIINRGKKDSVKKGMRFNIIRKTVPFRHPVTKELLGNLESTVGILEIKEVRLDSSIAEIIKGDAKLDDTVRISAKAINLLFCQSNNIDWYLSDSYYRKLKETGRFNMIDTSLETEIPSIAIEEGLRLNADVVVLLTAKNEEAGTVLTQTLFWLPEGEIITKMDTKIDVDYTKKLRFGEEFFSQYKEEALLKFDLPFSSKLLTSGDIDGDGTQEIIISSDNNISIYNLGVDLQPAFGGIYIKNNSLSNNLWIDTIDCNQNKKDEIIITSMKGNKICSYIYELKENEFILLYKKDNIFMRKIDNRLIGQNYSPTEGFEGSVFNIIWEGKYKIGKPIKLPEGVNIYDFVYINYPYKEKLILAYDEMGFINVYDSNGLNIWKSKSNNGGFLTKFRKSYSRVKKERVMTHMEKFADSSSSGIIDRGEWSIKDRLLIRNNEVFVVQRKPLLKMVKGLGYKNSQIKILWWNGLSMEEKVLLDGISGTILDYTFVGKKIVVLASPMFGVKFGNIFKGHNPLKTTIYIFRMKEF